MSISKTVGATVMPVAKDVPVTPMLMKPVLLWRHPPFGLGDPWSWYCQRALTDGRQQVPTELSQGIGAGRPIAVAAFVSRAALDVTIGNWSTASPTPSAMSRRHVGLRWAGRRARGRGDPRMRPFKYWTAANRNGPSASMPGQGLGDPGQRGGRLGRDLQDEVIDAESRVLVEHRRHLLDGPAERGFVGVIARQIGVADRDADRALDRGRIAAFRLERAIERTQRLAERTIRSAEPRHVPRVRRTRREAQHVRTITRDEDRDPATRRRREDRVIELLEPAGHRNAVPVEQPAEDRERLLETSETVVDGEAEGLVFGIVPSGSDAQDLPTGADLVQRGGHLRQQSGMTEARAHHERPELHAVRHRREGRQDRPGLVHRLDGSVIEPVEEVVEHPDRVETGILGGRGERPNVRPRWHRTVPVDLGREQDDTELHVGGVYGVALAADLETALRRNVEWLVRSA